MMTLRYDWPMQRVNSLDIQLRSLMGFGVWNLEIPYRDAHTAKRFFVIFSRLPVLQ